MADGDSRFSPAQIAGIVAVLVLVVLLLSTYFGGTEDTTPPSTAYQALQTGEPLPEGYGLPAQRRGPATKSSSSRLAADDGDSAEPPSDDGDEDQQEKKRRRSSKKRDRKSKPDQYGVYYFEDGSMDHSKSPPPG